jgi:predicted DNA-binding protein (MmcQ/YjbR family)
MKPAAAWKALHKHAAQKPGAWEDHPWGHSVFKAGKKMFVIFGDDDGYGVTCKLPDSGEAALTMFGWAAPTGYGLGKSGWVTARFGAKDDVPVELLREWIDESYAAIAPKRERPAAAKRERPAASKREPAAASKREPQRRGAKKAIRAGR